MSNRDAQFQNFAKLLMQDLLSENRVYANIVEGYGLEESQEIIARRAYDFAQHVLNSFELGDLETCDGRDEILFNIPDLTEWPEREESES
jgi:hypothetical protein